MTQVVVKNGNVDGAIEKFKKKVAKSGLPSKVNENKYYETRGKKARKKKNKKNKKNKNGLDK